MKLNGALAPVKPAACAAGMTWSYFSVPFFAAKVSQDAARLLPRTISSPTMIRMARPASRNSHFCTRQYTRPPKISSSANRTFSTVPNTKTYHCMWMPRKSCLASRSFAAVIQPWLAGHRADGDHARWEPPRRARTRR